MTDAWTRRKFLERAAGTGFAASSLSLLAACGSSSSSNGGATAGGTVTQWSDVTEAKSRAYFNTAIVSGFERQNRGIKLQVSFRRAEDLERQTRLALQARKAPDIISTNGPAFIPELADAGLLADLSPYAARGHWADDLLPWAADLGRVNGKLVAIPTQLEALGVYYNQSLFDKYGWKPPKDRAELEALAAEAQQRGILPFAGGSADLRQQIEWYTSVFFSHYAGPTVMYDVLTGKQPWTVGPMVEAVALMKDYFDKGYFGGGLKKFFATGGDAYHAQLAGGKAAMSMEGTWFFERIDTFFSPAHAEWNFTAFPSLRKDVPYPIYALGTGSTLSVNEASKSKDAAAKYIEFLIGDRKRAAKWLADQGSAFSYPLRFQAGDFPTTMDHRLRDVYASLAEATSNGNLGYTNWTFSPPRAAVYIYEKVEKVLTGDMSPEDYLKGVGETFQHDLDAGYKPRVPNPAASA
jgi:raffinose/stachyose/melibiose transport system substrate-binding protein